ncbi:MAG: DUF4405 domain-containing protein [Synergistaceae bacterium]|jgi:cytochrome b561|nr:DUF4405 domain-containing protein [Synergistaceae bacterium]
MPLRLAIRLIIDLAMTVLLLCAMAYRITGDVAHEWIGITVTALFILHNAVNWRWYRGIFTGKYDFRRVLNTAVNLLLFVTMAALVISGVLISRTVFAFMGFSGGMQIRQAHTAAAYWGLIFIAVHLGMHWEMIMAVMRRTTKSAGTSSVWVIIIMRTVTALIVIYGVYASFDREMGGKLFLGYSFDFWNPDRPAFLFFTSNLAIMGVYICLTYYALKLLAYRRTLKQGERQS